MTKVSVIVPVYGVEKYIERCARSLFEQTLDDIEYLFIDDCTPDQSMRVLKNVLEEYPRRKSQVVIHRMMQNSGQAKVREWGMKNVTGEYVIHCDSDDWVDTDMYRVMYEKAKADNSDVVLCDYYESDGISHTIHNGCNSEDISKLLNDILFQKVGAMLWNKMFRRGMISDKLIYPQGNLWEDMVITVQLLRLCDKISYVNTPYYYYYFNRSSIVNRRNIEKDLEKFISERDNLNLIVESLSEQFLIDRYENNINSLKFHTLHLLFPYTVDNLCYKLLVETYPNMFVKFMFLHNVSFRYKVSYVLALMRLYPFVWKLFTKKK